MSSQANVLFRGESWSEEVAHWGHDLEENILIYLILLIIILNFETWSC